MIYIYLRVITECYAKQKAFHVSSLQYYIDYLLHQQLPIDSSSNSTTTAAAAAA